MEEFEEYDMPVPCEHCGKLFELNDGYASEKWYPNIVICESCHEQEEKEIEEDDRWEDINIDLSNALYGLDKEENIRARLAPDNINLLNKISRLLFD
jgi:lysyl-tRNA synthetase class I